MVTFEEVFTLLKQGKTVELKFLLSFGLYSRHELALIDGKIEDFSYVDDSTSTYTIEQYKRSFHGKAFRSSAVEMLEVVDPSETSA